MVWKFKNIYYSFKPAEVPSTSRFHSIWDVQADHTYDVPNNNGFDLPGAFITYGGKGLIRLYREGKPTPLLPGSIYLINANDPCRYWCPDSEKWEFYFIRITSSDILYQLRLSFDTPLPCQDPAFLKRQGERIIDEMLRKAPGHMEAADNILRNLLLTTARQQQQHGSIVPDIIAWMYRNISQPVKIEQLQEQYHTGRTSLFKSFKQAIGCSPVAYFQEIKLESARLQLETTTRKVNQISAELGFYDEFHFSRLFKRAYGHAPGRYRTINRQRSDTHNNTMKTTSPKAGITIRPATTTDIDALVSVVETSFRTCVAPGYSPEGTTFFLLNSSDLYFQKRMREHALILAAESEQGIIGMIEIRDTNHIARFFVVPDHQHKGIGRQLFTAARTECLKRTKNLTELTVHASPNAVPAYERLGFTATDKERTANGMRYVTMSHRIP